MSLIFNLLAFVCTFTPPDQWEAADTRSFPPHVKVAYLGKNKQNFTPSLNLAVEEGVEGSLEEYLKCVKARFEKDRNNRWRDLGPFQTPAGPARLTSIDMQLKNDEARLLQLILVKDRVAYILTAAASKKEFPELQKLFERTFCSLQLNADPVESTPD